MSKYMDSIDFEELELFKKFNNREERQDRHVDSFFLDDPKMSEDERDKRALYNDDKLREDTRLQIEKLKNKQQPTEKQGE